MLFSVFKVINFVEIDGVKKSIKRCEKDVSKSYLNLIYLKPLGRPLMTYTPCFTMVFEKFTLPLAV